MDASGTSTQHRYVEVNGLWMHYAEAGEGEPVVFLHGFPESWYSWRHQIAAVSPHFRAIAPDLRGFNETEARGPYDTGTLQSDVIALIHHLGETSAHIVAHDWGAILGWLLAIEHPELVRSLTICNVPHPALIKPSLTNPGQLLRSWYIFFFQLPWLPERLLAREDYRWLARKMIRDCQAGTFTRDDVKEILSGWRKNGLGPGVDWYRALVRQQPHLPEPVPVIEASTLFIWGERDRYLGKELTEGTDALVRDLKMHFLPAASHWVQQEAPHTVNTLLLAHLAANKTPP